MYPTLSHATPTAVFFTFLLKRSAFLCANISHLMTLGPGGRGGAGSHRGDGRGPAEEHAPDIGGPADKVNETQFKQTFSISSVLFYSDTKVQWCLIVLFDVRW